MRAPSEEPPSEEPSAPTGEPTAGGTIIMGEWQAASQLNPFYTTAFTNFEALGPVLRSLLTIDNEGNWVRDLAAEVPSTENGGIVLDEDGDGFTLNVTHEARPALVGRHRAQPERLQVVVRLRGPQCDRGPRLLRLRHVRAGHRPLDRGARGPLGYREPVRREHHGGSGRPDDGSRPFRQNFAGWLGWLSDADPCAPLLGGQDPADSPTAMPVGRASRACRGTARS